MALLKIDGFNGKFQIAATNVAQPFVQAEEKPVLRSAPEEEKTRPTASFNLKKAFAESAKGYGTKKAEAVTEQKIQLTANDPFDVEKIKTVFDEYIRLNKPERTVAVSLKAHKPLIKDDEIILLIDNQLQLEKLETLKISLLNMLMKKLNNGSIKFSIQFFVEGQVKEKKTFITAQDKLEHFIKLNPVVGELKAAFGLELE